MIKDISEATLEELLTGNGEVNCFFDKSENEFSFVGTVTESGDNLKGYEEAVKEVLKSSN